MAPHRSDFSLNLPRYIDSTEPNDLQDIDAHLRGGIPLRDIDDLERYWQVFPAVRAALFKKAGRPAMRSSPRPSLNSKPPFSATLSHCLQQKSAFSSLKAIKLGDHPKTLIEMLSEDLLGTFSKARLLDPYDVYQPLMDYWAEVMQDDVYLSCRRAGRLEGIANDMVEAGMATINARVRAQVCGTNQDFYA